MNQNASKSKQNEIPEHNSCLIYECQYKLHNIIIGMKMSDRMEEYARSQYLPGIRRARYLLNM